MKKWKKLKEMNRWVLISIIVYVLILILLIIAAFLSSDPKHSLWSFAAVVWAILGFLLPSYTHHYTLRSSLPTLKRRAVVCEKKFVSEETWFDGYKIYQIPILIFQFENGNQLAFRVSHKRYKAFQCGETGTLVYKEGKDTAFFIDFIVHD